MRTRPRHSSSTVLILYSINLFKPSSIYTNQIKLYLLIYFDQNNQNKFNLFHNLYSHRLLPDNINKNPDVPPLLQLFEKNRLKSEKKKLYKQSDPYNLQIPS